MLQVFPDIADHIWNAKYRYKDEKSIDETFRRVAKGLAETKEDCKDFEEIMIKRRFCPAGRILSTVGTQRKNATSANCFAMPQPLDSMDDIMDCLKNSAMTSRSGGGIGINFDLLRPHGEIIKGVESYASGPVSFMAMWITMCKTIASYGMRRGAMLFTLNYAHPDI